MGVGGLGSGVTLGAGTPLGAAAGAGAGSGAGAVARVRVRVHWWVQGCQGCSCGRELAEELELPGCEGRSLVAAAARHSWVRRRMRGLARTLRTRFRVMTRGARAAGSATRDRGRQAPRCRQAPHCRRGPPGRRGLRPSAGRLEAEGGSCRRVAVTCSGCRTLSSLHMIMRLVSVIPHGKAHVGIQGVGSASFAQYCSPSWGLQSCLLARSQTHRTVISAQRLTAR